MALLAAVGAGRVQEHRRGLRGHDPRGAAKRAAQRPAKEHYDRAFPIYQQLYRSLKDDFKTIAALET